MKNSNMYLGRRWYGISRKWFENDSVVTQERLGSVVSRFSLASLICLCMLTVGVGNAWAESYDQTITYTTLNSEEMLGGSYADAGSYYKVPASSNNTATINIPSSYFNHTPTGNVTIILSLSTFGSGTDPSTSNTTITATGTETSSTWNTSSYSGTLPSSSTYNNITLTLSKVASPTTLSGVTISIHISTGVKILRLQSVRIQYAYSSTPATITLSEAGVSTNVSGTHYAGETYTLPTSTDATCGTKILVGWSTVTISGTDTKPTSNFYETGDEVILAAGANTYYAVFATQSGGGTATWTRVTNMATLTGGGTFIMGYEATAKSGTIVPLRSADCGATTSANGILNSGTSSSTSDRGTIDMSDITTTSDYEVYVSCPTSGKINIQRANSSGSYYGASSTGSSKNTARLYSSGNTAETNIIPEWASETNNQFKLRVDVTGSYKYLKYNTGSPRYAFYDSAGEKIVFYKKGNSYTYSAYSTSCEACTANPTVGTAQLKGSFSLSSVGVTCPTTGTSVGTNCSWTDYGFVWGTSANPTIGASGCTKVQIGTSGSATTWDGTLTGTFSTGTTYYYRAYGKNAKDGAAFVYGNVSSFKLQKVVFNANGGTGTMSDQAVLYNTATALTSNSFTRDGFGFEGWATSSDGDVVYADGANITLTADQTLYAKWGAVHYTITYDHGTNGTGSISAGDKTHGVDFTLSSSTFTRTGYTQDGWSTSDGGSKDYELGGSYTANAAITLYPHWAINNYTVSWSVNGSTWSSGVTDANNNANYGSTVSAPTAPTSSDCDDSKVFVGWTNAEYSNPSTAPTTLFTSTSPAITTNTTFYAVFAEASSGGGVATVFSEDFSDCTGTGGNSGGWSGSIASTTTPTSISSSWFLSYDKAADGCLKLGTGDYAGSATTPNIDCGAATSATLTFRAGSWSGDGTVLGLTGTNCTLSESSITLSDASFTSYTISITSITDEISITFASAKKKQRFFLDDVVVKTSSVSYSNYTTSCCQQPATQLSMSADKTELVGTGLIELSLAGGNGEDITWSCRDEADNDCDALLSSTSNSGATLTISSPVAATKTYTVKAVQPENDDDTEVICGKTLTIDITVKTQWTITFKTTDGGSLSTHNTVTVTDGDSYTFPDLSDEYTCETNYSFVGWKATNTDGAPEYEGGSSAKATENTTWYAVWMYSTGTTTETRDKYELVTSSSTAIAEDDVVVIACNTQGVALAQMSTSDTYGSHVPVDFATDKSYLTFASGTNVMELKLYWCSTDDDYSYNGWAFEDYNNADQFLSYGDENGNYNGTLTYLDEYLWMFTISFDGNGIATISDPDPDYSSYKLQYRKETSRFAFYSGTNKAVQLYRKNGTVSVEVPTAPTYSVNNTHCTNGATIRATDGQWVTSAKNQKVRITVPVTAKNFETSGKQLTASSDNSHFSVLFPNHTIPSNKSEVVVNMVVEYTPIEANTIEEANITITTGTGDGDATKVVSVNGRSLPDEFVIVMQKEGKWQALPANMESGATTYSGVEVTPNGGITAIPAAPFNVIYSAREVASSRYEAAGNCVRLVGNNNKCLWGNNSTNTTSIQNWSTLSNTNGAQYEWLLSTADGETYTIANPNHPDYGTGRQLAIYALKYGLYKTDATFYLLPVGCSSQPGNLQIVPRRIDATFSWISNASSVTIDLWTNEEMDEGHLSATATSVPYLFTGLAESTQYWYKITPGSNDDCAVTGTFSTNGPTIDVVEWGENSATIFVDIDPATANDPSVSPQIIIAGEVEHGQGSGAAATDIFFSKYFEAEGTAKMLAIYNGTGNAMSLADITILHRSTTKKYTPLSLASYGKTAGWIQPGEEIILFNRDVRTAVMSCAESDPTYPSWNNVEDKNLEFSGKGTIRLFRGNECIDIIGAMEEGDDINDKAVDPIEGSGSPTFGDANGFVSTSGDNYATKGTVENNYELSTNRCLLIRQNWVTSGDSAVLNNYDDFKTLGTYTGVDSKTHKGEWAGLQIPTAVAPETDYIHTCEGFQEVGKFDYNKYYREYTQIGADKYLKDFTRAEDGTYTLPISYMRQYACLNLKFQLTDHSDKETILTEKVAQVPIVVKDARNSNDTLFTSIIKADEAPHAPMTSESIERCKTCNVVVLGTGTLTKAADGTTNDVAELGDVKVYPGGKLIVPSNRHYVFNSLAMRRQEDEVALADIQGGLAESATDASDKGLYIRRPNGVYLDVRINPDNWHFIALPYDCRVGDIMLSDGTPAVVNTDYLLGWYDGAKRAANKSGGWTYITDKDYVLKKGLGYILALPGTDKVKKELRFPMANSVIDEELSNKSIGGLYAYGGDKSDEELRPNHKGWNMIGNPYMITYETDIVETPLAMGLLEHDLVNGVWYGQWKRTGSARYIVKPVDNGWSDYIQTTITDLEPFTSYFIQIGNSTDGSDNPETENNITFTASKAERASIIRHAQAETDEPMYPVWYGVDIIAPNAERDNTTLLISDEFTDGYDMMDDLVKMRGDYYTYYNKPVLASRNNEGEMAFNALPDNSAAEVGVPLNYYAAQAGTYTIATDSRYDLEEVKSAVLYDATNNTYTDLLTQNYEFTASKGNNTERFTLYVRVERKKAPNSATDIDNLLADGELSLISMGKTLVLSGLTGAADVYVYDMSGKLMNSDHASGSGGIWRTTVPTTGVYFVRVNGVNGQQTLRAIVK